MRRISWDPILDRAGEVVRSFNAQGVGVTMRGCHYVLLGENLGYRATKANGDASDYCYKRLSELTAKARRPGHRLYPYPSFVDETRRVARPLGWSNADAAFDWLIANFRVDRTDGQPIAVYLGGEKRGHRALLSAWFGDRGLPILPLGGFASQTFADDVRRDVAEDGRKSILLYMGDLDPSGVCIQDSFEDRTGYCFDQVIRVAVVPEQVTRYDLPILPAKRRDSRNRAFEQRFGALFCVETEAIPPDVLRGLFLDALDPLWDTSVYELALRAEADAVADLIGRWTP